MLKIQIPLAFRLYIPVSQLDGEIKVINKKGTTFLFNFTKQK